MDAVEGKQNQWRCPKCGSEQTQRVAILRGMGTAALSASTVGVAAGGESFGDIAAGIGAAATAGTLTSTLAAQLAPPARPKPPGTMGGVIGCLLGVAACVQSGGASQSLVPILFPVFGTFLGAAVHYALLAGEYKKRVAAHEHALQAWERSFLCMRCGERFKIQ